MSVAHEMSRPRGGLFPGGDKRVAAGTRGVLVRVGDDWLPAVVDRSRQVAVEAMLLHDVIADEEFTGIGPKCPPNRNPGPLRRILRRRRRFRGGSIRPTPRLAGQVSQLPANW